MLLCWSQLDRVVWYRALNRVSVFCSWPINVLQKPGSARWGVPFFLVLCQLFYCSCVSIIDNEYYIFSEEFASILVSNRLF